MQQMESALWRRESLEGPETRRPPRSMSHGLVFRGTYCEGKSEVLVVTALLHSPPA